MVLQDCRCAGLALEPRQKAAIVGILVGQYLQRDSASLCHTIIGVSSVRGTEIWCGPLLSGITVLVIPVDAAQS